MAVVPAEVRACIFSVVCHLTPRLSGPKRYDYDKKTGHWVYGRDASSLRSLLVTELADITKLSPADTSRELGEGGTFE
jgi:hypothetical protein